MVDDEPWILGADLDRVSVARMYDYFLGGRLNFAVDREIAEQVKAVDPGAVRAISQARSFTRRAVRLCAEAGIDQFLDLGSGIPTVGNVHEVARTRVPHARVAYVDHDAVAVHHTRELLRDVKDATITRADVRDVEKVLASPGVTEVLDFDRPVAVLMLLVLHFVPGDPGPVVEAYRRALAPGSALAISHSSADWADEAVAGAMRRRHEIYRRSAAPTTLRERSAIAALFAGTELVAPGLVDVVRWRPDTHGTDDPVGIYSGVGFLPGRPVDR